MRNVDADVLREHVQDYFNCLKAAMEREHIPNAIVSTVENINAAMMTIIDAAPTNYTTRGY